MLRKALVVLFLAVQFLVVANVKTDIIQLPRCFPCAQ